MITFPLSFPSLDHKICHANVADTDKASKTRKKKEIKLEHDSAGCALTCFNQVSNRDLSKQFLSCRHIQNVVVCFGVVFFFFFFDEHGNSFLPLRLRKVWVGKRLCDELHFPTTCCVRWRVCSFTTGTSLNLRESKQNFISSWHQSS